jgi:hypothetical protein
MEPAQALAAILILGATNAAITLIAQESTLFEPLRKWFDSFPDEWPSELMHCPVCLGTWVGAAIAAAAVYELEMGWTFDALLAGIVVTLSTMIVGAFIRLCWTRLAA